MLSLFEQEKLLLVTAIMYAGKKGFDEFERVINKKVGYQTRCLSELEMVEVLKNIGMPDHLIEGAMLNIKLNTK